ncbi:MAG: sigma-70 family RNA polymerase sigma factor [Anaerolineales bacterium]|jgi:RNA polymerase sigma-70 factor (ECF subfamily)|nr:sigma-70 family RNA polymerase sigma factor [Anaerolineales bacterium]
MDEHQAITRLKQGDLAGLECLVQQYQVKAVHTAYLITGDPAQAEDLVQSAFLRLAHTIDQFDDQRPFRPWFLRSVVNAAVKAARRNQRTLSLDEPAEAVIDWLLDAGPQPEELVEASELRQAVWNAIQQLTPEQRAVIVQRHFLEMSEAEMAANLQRPASTVKWWLHTARARLKNLLGAYRNEAENENEK